MVVFLQENKSLNGKKFCFHISLVFCCPSVSNIWYLETHVYTSHVYTCLYFAVGSLVRFLLFTRCEGSQVARYAAPHGVIIIYYTYYDDSMCKHVQPHIGLPMDL